MDPKSGLAGGGAGGGPLQTAAPDRMNQRHDSIMSPLRNDGRDNSVHEKISQFNSLSIAMQSKQLERKTADAALKRAMVGREEAEAEMRRLREETRQLQRVIQEGRERERRVGERLETVMENYGRAKETHAHTQALWEKEIRRARKENFKTQSTIVKLQEELKTARSAVRILEETVEREKERSRVRENEAFAARYQLVGAQEQLDDALERVKVAEQERDAFKTAAKNEEVARIAAEGRLPLPKPRDPGDEFASPRKPTAIQYHRPGADARLSLTTMELVSSAASEMEIEELTTQVLWERQRADRAQEVVDFLQAECQMHCCPCSRTRPARTSPSPRPKRRRESESESVECPVEAAHTRPDEAAAAVKDEAERRRDGDGGEEGHEEEEEEEEEARRSPIFSPRRRRAGEAEARPVKSRKHARRSTIFCPKEGIFRTVSEQEAEALEAQQAAEAAEPELEPEAVETNCRMYARTPSVDPPAFAMVQERASLESLLHAPHTAMPPPPPPPAAPSTTPCDAAADDDDERADEVRDMVALVPRRASSPEPPRPHTSATAYAVTTTTTRVPVRDDRPGSALSASWSSASRQQRQRTPSAASSASFDHTNPALTPTMTREQALAKIRERRGRVRSAHAASSATTTTTTAATRRDMSAPTTGRGARARW